ncbi:hypothetical protein KCP76_06555 [Salmonella enterica subsp. enterica serovar Weltevreden]|nr:hypothetical protein KCP76_06555 [Salmonella enterica subsp. enterica serovar Weltevreden]
MILTAACGCIFVEQKLNESRRKKALKHASKSDKSNGMEHCRVLLGDISEQR